MKNLITWEVEAVKLGIKVILDYTMSLRTTTTTNNFKARWWWCTPLIPALGRQKLVDLCEFKASSQVIQRNPVSKNKQKEPGHKSSENKHKDWKVD